MVFMKYYQIDLDLSYLLQNTPDELFYVAFYNYTDSLLRSGQ